MLWLPAPIDPCPVCHSNHAVLPNTLPWQSEHESSQLLLLDRSTRVGSGRRPDELSLIHPPCRQPDSGPVVDEYLHAVGTTVGEVDEAAQQRPLDYRTGRRELVKVLRKMRNTSTHHVTLNLQASNRPPREILEELATDVLPEFQTADES